jgi:site-specific DNA-methyltransferase (adenine-specific)
MINLYKGNCLEVMKQIPDGSIDAIITDPPYGTTQCKWDSVINFDLMWEQLNRITKPNGAIVLFGAEPFSSALRMSNIKNYKYDWIWKKSKPTGHLNAKKQPLRQTEAISVFYKKQCTYNPQGTKPTNKVVSRTNRGNYGECSKTTVQTVTNYPRNIITFNSIDGVHQTQKPVDLMEYLIKTYTNENETILDFTMGSGSTGLAAKNLNRNFIGIEQDENYFNIATDRINKVEPQTKLF